ncbi:hypothetical protein ENKNEFLB_01689 [Nocardioides aquaticus]|uniref:Uncharacterized protein n=4 Tax=Actinomycetes TaxID=1760 RepID=A0ABX8EL20_9ACTN|nr:hypothetical protein [Nocardioides aquaticus]QVT79308.1 hypothetical protein ENKNEFLB_01689 [Nocardioides aquaticus]
MKSDPSEYERIREYWEGQWPDDPLIHLEKAASERVGSVPHDIWDLHAESGRWWVVTNPTNLYSQEDFKSRDVVLTFHVGLVLRMMSREVVPITESAAALLPAAWRRWDQAVEALQVAREAEDYQAVGMRLRECLVSFAEEVADDALVPEGTDRPQAANVKAWINLFAGYVAGGPSAAKLRSYLKTMGEETWSYVNWLTHAKNAAHFDAEIGAAVTSHLLATVTASAMRARTERGNRCHSCDSYAVVAGRCDVCGWIDEEYEAPPSPPEPDEEDLAARLADPCTPSSDISTFITPEEFGQRPARRRRPPDERS